MKVPSPGANILGLSRRRRSVLRRTQEGVLKSEGKKDKTKSGSLGCGVSPASDTYIFCGRNERPLAWRQQGRDGIIPGANNTLPLTLVTTPAEHLFRANLIDTYSERGPPIPNQLSNVKLGAFRSQQTQEQCTSEWECHQYA